MERRPDAPPKSLAQLIARRGRGQGRTAGREAGSGWPSAEPTADALGQFGLLFAEPAAVVEDAPIEELEIETLVSDTPLSSARQGAPALAAEARKLWSVAELVGVLRGRLEREYGDVWVEGEISNVRPYGSGALYFTLKDGDAQLPAVLFKRQAAMLKWKPADGMAVLARGRVSVYESRGQLQLIAETLEPRGAGALQVQFEQLKTRLRDEGLFDSARKRALPAYPGTIGVVTSTKGAVIRDIVTVCRRRGGCMNIVVYPAAVQGMGAAAEIAAGVRYFNAHPGLGVDVVVVARGGGSTEDLWAFNDEALARTIAASTLPVVSAVGHETDFTIADFVADLRAPTPSAAAEMITEAQHRAGERVDALRARLLRGVRWQAMGARQRFSRVSAEGALRRVPEALERRAQRVDDLRTELSDTLNAALRVRLARVHALESRLLRRDVSAGIAAGRGRLLAVETRLQHASQRLVGGRRSTLERARVRLDALSPMAVLERGYTLAFAADGRLVRSVTQVGAGESMRVRMMDGSVETTVSSVAVTPIEDVG